VVLIAVVVVLGLFLLRAMDEDATSAVDGDEVSTADDAGDDAAPEGDSEGDGAEAPADDATTETSAEAELRPPSEITVMVLNASGVGGAAAAQTDKITGAGYLAAPADNSPLPSKTTQVQFAEGYEREAAALAEAIGAADGATAPLAPDLGVDLQGSQLVVILGNDLAGG
jgi:hypothetical protein